MLLMKFSSLLVIACGLLALLQASVSALTSQQEEQLRESYVKMEECLVKKAKKPVDMDKSMKLIHSCAKYSLSFKTGKEPLKAARNSLNGLTELTESQLMCSVKGYNRISETLRLSKGLPRLRQVVKQFVAKNAKYCQPVYADLSEQGIDAELDRHSRKSLVTFTWNLAEQLTGLDGGRLSKTLRDVIESNQNSTLNLYEFIQTKIRNNPKQVDLAKAMVDALSELDKPDYKRYLDNYDKMAWNTIDDEFTWHAKMYVVQPCATFVRHANSEKIFHMASVHSRVLKRNLNVVEMPEKPEAAGWDLVGLYKDWIRYEICWKYLLKDPREIDEKVRLARARALKYDPENREPDQNMRMQVPVDIPDRKYDDDDLFEANE